MSLTDPFFWADIIGVVFFALSGAMVAVRKNLDLLGLFIASNLTALGGGVIRDLIVDRTPLSFSLIYPSLTVLITLIGFIFFKWFQHVELEKRTYFVLSDSIGLVAFSVAGALVAITHEFNLFGVVVLAFTTAVGGGIIRDVMINELPAVLISDFYGTIAILTALLLYALHLFEALTPLTILLVALFTLLVRLVAYYKKWRLPQLS